ncbi:MAG: GntR family transcriptional regulator, partial [Candidatus Nanopelagicales bacterium]
RESGLGEQRGLGRTPVRYALRARASEHLIEVYPRRGMFVAGVDPRDLRAISEVREQLEPFAAKLAAERRDDVDLVVIDELLADLAAFERGDVQEHRHVLMDLDERIHHVVYQASHNAYLAHDLDSYYTHALRIWFLGLTKVTHLQQAVLEHREILEAIRDGDAERAAVVMSKHIEGFEAEMRRAL